MAKMKVPSTRPKPMDSNGTKKKVPSTRPKGK